MERQCKTAACGKKQMREGMTLLDLILTIGIVGIAIAGIIWMWGGAKGNLEEKKLSDKVTVVINAIEKAKSDYNSDTYVASSSKTLPNITKLKLAVGGQKAVRSVGGWKYKCSSGYNSTITVTSENLKNTELIDGVATKVNDKYTDWIATRSGNTLVLKRSNSNCQ